jgi:hypothetical protein
MGGRRNGWRVCDTCTVSRTPTAGHVAVFLAGLGTLAACETCHSFVPSAAEVAVLAFLKARSEGDSGVEFWARPNPNFRDIDRRAVAQIVNPSEWRFIRATVAPKRDWASLRYRVKSTREDGTPIEKVWDFCLIEVETKYSLIGLLEAQEGTVSGCENHPNWTE